MPRKNSRRNMKGGWDWPSGMDVSSGWNSFTNWGTGIWGKLTGPDKTASYSSGTPSYSSETPSYSSGTPSYSSGTPSYSSGTPSYSSGTPSYNSETVLGGKKRRNKSKKMRGGNFTDNTPTTGLAYNAASFSGETARPNTWVGGKTKKRRKRNKSCKKR